MRERPILFSGEMVRAILAGKKTQTRRLVMVTSNDGRHTIGDDWRFVSGRDTAMGQRCYERGEWLWQHRTNIRRLLEERCPYGQVGDRLWVKETHALLQMPDGRELCAYRASCSGDAFNYVCENGEVVAVDVRRWRPSLFMRRELSRLTVEVTCVRVERLQSITEDDARAEGVDPYECPGGPAAPSARGAFRELWDRINGERAAWASNPWVWVVSFKPVEVRRAA